MNLREFELEFKGEIENAEKIGRTEIEYTIMSIFQKAKYSIIQLTALANVFYDKKKLYNDMYECEEICDTVELDFYIKAVENLKKFIFDNFNNDVLHYYILNGRY